MNEAKKSRLEPITVDRRVPVLDALKRMDREDRKLLLVQDGDTYHGLLSIGDIQRAIIANRSLDTPVGEVMRKNIRVAHARDPFEDIRAMMIRFRTEFMPVLDDQGNLTDVFFWDDVAGGRIPSRHPIDLPVVVMAGGKGTRLKPFSNILPKPLFPLGDKTILEVILDKFRDAGCSHFWVSVNYKASFIQTYLDQLELPPGSVQTFREPEPLGTAGSLHLIRDHIREPFFVTNCDIIINTDYSEIVQYHREHRNEITVVAALKHFQVPYGTLETGEGGRLLSLREKPEWSHLINAGLYLLEPGLLHEIPEQTFYHITHLIDAILQRSGRVGVYPVSENSWSDIGQWDEYRRTLSKLGTHLPI